MTYEFKQGTTTDLKQIYDLINARMDWMVVKGIKQWDHDHYWSVYPKSYYENQVDLGQLYVLKEDDVVLGAVVLYESDESWQEDEPLDSYYLHNFVTTLKQKGIGKIVMAEVEKLGKCHHKQAIRLDCMVSNTFLNRYYQELGYVLIGECFEGIYHGNKREKRIDK